VIVVIAAGLVSMTVHTGEQRGQIETGEDLQTEPLKQNGLMVCGVADTALADGDARSRGQHHIDSEICSSSVKILRGSSPRPARLHHMPKVFQST
jgi:hypothetical protein